jgi:hypothetical protein
MNIEEILYKPITTSCYPTRRRLCATLTITAAFTVTITSFWKSPPGMLSARSRTSGATLSTRCAKTLN